MKATAYFINIGRGMTAHLGDLTGALSSGTIWARAGAGLDVFEIERPLLPDDHPLWHLENVLITPHVAVADADDASRRIPERRYQLLLDNARRSPSCTVPLGSRFAEERGGQGSVVLMLWRRSIRQES